MGSLERTLRLPSPPARQFPVPEPAKVLQVLADGRLMVESTSRPGVVWGPALWGPRPRPGAGGVAPLPPVGTACLVVHAGSGVEAPWVVALDWQVPA